MASVSLVHTLKFDESLSILESSNDFSTVPVCVAINLFAVHSALAGHIKTIVLSVVDPARNFIVCRITLVRRFKNFVALHDLSCVSTSCWLHVSVIIRKTTLAVLAVHFVIFKGGVVKILRKPSKVEVDELRVHGQTFLCRIAHGGIPAIEIVLALWGWYAWLIGCSLSFALREERKLWRPIAIHLVLTVNVVSTRLSCQSTLANSIYTLLWNALGAVRASSAIIHALLQRWLVTTVCLCQLFVELAILGSSIDIRTFKMLCFLVDPCKHTRIDIEVADVFIAQVFILISLVCTRVRKDILHRQIQIVVDALIFVKMWLWVFRRSNWRWITRKFWAFDLVGAQGWESKKQLISNGFH